jgi:superfamily II DNA or RNA helicase
MTKYRMGQWDGYITLYKNGKFPSGLVSNVIQALDGHAVEVINRYSDEYEADYDVIGAELRDYQKRAVDICLEQERGTLWRATNAGKTYIMAALISAKGYRAVVIVPNRNLLFQTSEELSDLLGVEVGRYGAGHTDVKDVTVVMMQSLKKFAANNDLKGNRLVIGDECHRTKADQIFRWVFSIPGRYRIAMSGTPLTMNVLHDMKLVGAFGPVIHKVSNQELIEQGFSVKPVIRVKEMTSKELATGTYQEVYRKCIVSNPARNMYIAQQAAEEQKHGPVLVLVDWKEHGRNICDILEIIGDGHIFATGDNTNDELQEIMEKFDGSNDILVATNIFGEGVNLPHIRSIILAAGGKSHIRLLQRIGRGLRTADGKDRIYVLDFLDDLDEKGYLLEHSEERFKVYREEGFEVELL